MIKTKNLSKRRGCEMGLHPTLKKGTIILENSAWHFSLLGAFRFRNPYEILHFSFNK
jgi:hypothetical protein